MVVLVDLDDEAIDPLIDLNGLHDSHGSLYRGSAVSSPQRELSEGKPKVDSVRSNPNINGFSAALSCYPIVSQLARLLDLNSLHDLARTCRQFRANLLQYRNQLVNQTLRCSNEDISPGFKLAERLRESHSAWRGSISGQVSGGSATNDPVGRIGQPLGQRITSGKVGRCARDMVGECRRCGTIVCRNCTTKSLPTQALQGRHRRLCTACTRLPLGELLANPVPNHPLTPPQTPDLTPVRVTPSPPRPSWLRLTEGGMGSCTSSPLSSSDHLPVAKTLASNSTSSLSSTAVTLASESSKTVVASASSQPTAFTASAFSRTPCTCPTDFYLCYPCGMTLRSDDITYHRGWTWRTRYSTYLGGLGTGIGEGNEGVPCGRGARCANARCVEQEVDLDAEGWEEMRREWERADWIAGASSGVALGGYAGDAGTVSSANGSTSTTTSPAPSSSDAQGGAHARAWRGGSWNVQECEGIGGVMRKKVKKVVRVGAVVREFEDERGEAGPDRVLKREQRGERRSWCAWCERVIPGAKDLGRAEGSVT